MPKFYFALNSNVQLIAETSFKITHVITVEFVSSSRQVITQPAQQHNTQYHHSAASSQTLRKRMSQVPQLMMANQQTTKQHHKKVKQCHLIPWRYKT